MIFIKKNKITHMWTAFCLFCYHSQCLVVSSTDVASTWNVPLGIFLRKFLVWVEWGEAIHSKYGWDYSICWGPGNKCEKVSWAPTRVCPSASWLCVQCDELHAPATNFPTLVDCPLKLWDGNLSFLCFLMLVI